MSKSNSNDSGVLVQCEECGRMFAALQSHLRSKHEMSVEEYCQKHEIDPTQTIAHSGVTREELLNSVNDLAEELDKVPTTVEMMDEGEYSTKPFYDHFGSWENVLKEAGLWTK